MTQASRKNSASEPVEAHVLLRRVQEGALITISAVSLFLILALISYWPQDPGWSYSGPSREIQNQGGVIGAWLADVLLYLFGFFAYLFPLMLAFSGWLIYRGRLQAGALDYFHLTLRSLGFIMTLAMGCGLAWLHFSNGLNMPHDAGGIFGDVIGQTATSIFGLTGGTLLMLALFLAAITLFTGLSWFWLMDVIGEYTLKTISLLRERWEQAEDLRRGNKARKQREETVKVEKKRKRVVPKPRIEPIISSLEIGERAEQEKQEVLFEAPTDSVLPTLQLLDPVQQLSSGYSADVLEALSRQVELKLADFGVSVEVVAVQPGPVVTRFEMQPAPGVKASKIVTLSKDLARSLSTVSVRVVEVIPGKSVIGLEIPNETRELVSLSDMLNSREFERSNAPLSLVLGKDIAGAPIVVDLARMPHLLVAGTTGSGKSVGLNAMIMSLVYKSKPCDVRLIMIDPKMLELSVYEDIPHLLAPVVTDMKEAANALRWSVGEMERRYKLMAALGVRNISGYNRKVNDAIAKGKPIKDPLFKPEESMLEEAPDLEPVPYIVVIIDELADMMMVVGKKVEELIARLAQKARASGIHLILATQRPSVDVITGLIKANIPTRIAFQVSSRIDSRTILDQMGAEHLLGNGDMLYLPPGTGLPERVHGAFVSDDEVHRVVAFLKSHGEPDYIEEVLAGPQNDGADGIPGMEMSDESDPLYDQAVRIVTETRRASISGVQRRLKVGYNRAARLVETMEAAGIVGELQSNGSREVLAPPPPKD